MVDQPQPYSVSVPDDALQELKQRLAWARFPSQLESPDQDSWDFGVPAAEVQRLAIYWKDGFDWRKAEAQLNELPQYHTDIEVEGFGSLDIHCKSSQPIRSTLHFSHHPLVVHQTSPVENAVPLLFCHGCKS